MARARIAACRHGIVGAKGVCREGGSMHSDACMHERRLHASVRLSVRQQPARVYFAGGGLEGHGAAFQSSR